MKKEELELILESELWQAIVEDLLTDKEEAEATLLKLDFTKDESMRQANALQTKIETIDSVFDKINSYKEEVKE